MKSLSVFLLLFPVFSYAQEATGDFVVGSLKISQDPRVDRMLSDYAKYYKKHAFIHGYRIQIFSGDKVKAMEKRKAYQRSGHFVDIPYSTLLYEAPNWKVHIGNYRNKHKATKQVEQIRKTFRGAIVVNVRISTNKFY